MEGRQTTGDLSVYGGSREPGQSVYGRSREPGQSVCEGIRDSVQSVYTGSRDSVATDEQLAGQGTRGQGVYSVAEYPWERQGSRSHSVHGMSEDWRPEYPTQTGPMYSPGHQMVSGRSYYLSGSHVSEPSQRPPSSSYISQSLYQQPRPSRYHVKITRGEARRSDSAASTVVSTSRTYGGSMPNITALMHTETTSREAYKCNISRQTSQEIISSSSDDVFLSPNSIRASDWSTEEDAANRRPACRFASNEGRRHSDGASTRRSSFDGPTSGSSYTGYSPYPSSSQTAGPLFPYQPVVESLRGSSTPSIIAPVKQRTATIWTPVQCKSEPVDPSLTPCTYDASSTSTDPFSSTEQRFQFSRDICHPEHQIRGAHVTTGHVTADISVDSMKTEVNFTDNNGSVRSAVASSG